MTKGKDTKAKEQNATESHPLPTALAEQDDVAAFKRALLEVIEQHRAAWEQLPEDKAYLLEREGEPVAVVMAFQGFDALLERLEDLEDAESAREGLKAIESGEETTIPWEQVEAELRAEGLMDE
jgi:PHD/YefM family antitoxin component YafN of YafNO toxin-antitoxin module